MKKVLMSLLAGLALAALSACGGSPESTPQPGAQELIPTQAAKGDVDHAEVETTQTEPETQAVHVGEFETLNFLSFAATSMNTEIADLSPREVFEIAGTGCQAKYFEYKEREMDGGGVHFALTPDGERIAGAEEGSIQAVLNACYDSQGIEITSDQLVQLVVNFGEVRFPRAEDEPTKLALNREGIPYEPPNYELDGDDFTFSVLVNAREFGDVYRVHVERSGADFTVEYDQIHRG